MVRRKFQQSLSPEVVEELEEIAKQRGMKIQQLIRYVIIPEWQAMRKAKQG